MNQVLERGLIKFESDNKIIITDLSQSQAEKMYDFAKDSMTLNQVVLIRGKVIRTYSLAKFKEDIGGLLDSCFGIVRV